MILDVIRRRGPIGPRPILPGRTVRAARRPLSLDHPRALIVTDPVAIDVDLVAVTGPRDPVPAQIGADSAHTSLEVLVMIVAPPRTVSVYVRRIVGSIDVELVDALCKRAFTSARPHHLRRVGRSSTAGPLVPGVIVPTALDGVRLHGGSSRIVTADVGPVLEPAVSAARATEGTA